MLAGMHDELGNPRGDERAGDDGRLDELRAGSDDAN